MFSKKNITWKAWIIPLVQRAQSFVSMAVVANKNNGPTSWKENILVLAAEGGTRAISITSSQNKSLTRKNNSGNVQHTTPMLIDINYHVQRQQRNNQIIILPPPCRRWSDAAADSWTCTGHRVHNPVCGNNDVCRHRKSLATWTNHVLLSRSVPLLP
jgi:hypothetical protein